MNDTAIVIGTHDRGHLLRRSLLHYPKDITVYVYDDASMDNTNNVVGEAILDGWHILYKPIYRKPGWRDSAAYLNAGLRQALAQGYEYIFITHPEIIPGKTTIDSAKAMSVSADTWVSCKGYYLTPEQQQHLTDDCNVKDLPNFYGQAQRAEFTGNPDYTPEAIEKAAVWHSWIFAGGRRDMWQYFGGLTEFDTWGSVDVDLLNRRTIAGMKTVTPGKDTDIVIHQNHDDLNTPRDMGKCMAALPVYASKEQALKPELLKYEPD